MHEVRYWFRPGHNRASIAGATLLGQAWWRLNCTRLSAQLRFVQRSFTVQQLSCFAGHASKLSKEPVREAAQLWENPRRDLECSFARRLAANSDAIDPERPYALVGRRRPFPRYNGRTTPHAQRAGDRPLRSVAGCDQRAQLAAVIPLNVIVAARRRRLLVAAAHYPPRAMIAMVSPTPRATIANPAIHPPNPA